MEVIDAHQHFWDIDANYHPWLDDRPVQLRYGNYDALKRNYLPQDYLADSRGIDLIGSVYVEAEWNPDDPLGEVAWVEKMRDRCGLPTVMVAQAWLDADDVETVLAALAITDFVRGIRHKPRASAGPDDAGASMPGSMRDPRWQRGFAMLGPMGLSFDLQVPWWHLAEAAELAAKYPKTQIIVNHTGMPQGRSDVQLAPWRQAMRVLAEASNVAVKISGLGIIGERWTAERNRAVVLDTIDIFGVQRCMFASNFPVDSLVGSFPQIYAGFHAIVAGFSQADQAAMFHGNAMKFYRIGQDQLRGENHE